MRFLKTASLLTLVAAVGCAKGPSATPMPADAITEAGVSRLLSQLADDSLLGRMTGQPGAEKAAAMIAREMAAIGLLPAGDSGYFQRVPYIMRPGRNGGMTPRLAASFSALDTVPAERRKISVNVLGILPGVDANLRNEHVLVDGHYDHVGVGRPVNGDSIYNGADDDASGIVATLFIARAIRQGPAPRRSILFAAMTGEELGLTGARWYVDHPVLPLSEMVVNLEIEMIGRPDSLSGGSGSGWLTGYERSTMGEMLARAGIPLVADPRPSQNFFQRSDNYALALRGVVAHTLSSYDLHADYHQPSDDASKADPVHMAQVIRAAARAVRLLADGPKPEWKPGGKPEPTPGPRPRPTP